MSDHRPRALTALVLAVLAFAGLASAGYVLLHERAPVPFRDSYKLRVEVSAADGVQPGLGQPVRVAGVGVGTVTGLKLQRDNALITLSIDRHQLPHVYADAHVSLEPITPLKDMQIVLDPGGAPAPALADGATLSVGRSRVPVPLSDLLSSLDGDTRAFLASLLSAVQRGTHGQGANLRRVLTTLGPTTKQVRAVSASLADRRRALARLVHNVALVTRAAADDGQLSDVVLSSQRTLHAVASQQRALRQTIARMPGALQTTSSALRETGDFARELRPALTALMPAVTQLPVSLNALKPFAETGATALLRGVRPFVRTAVPAARRVAPAVASFDRQAPDLIAGLKGLNYFFNELAYNPPGQKLGHDDEGFLFWAPWFFHNYNSMISAKDAHGGIARGQVMVSCQQVLSLAGFDEILRLLVPTYTLCPRK